MQRLQYVEDASNARSDRGIELDEFRGAIASPGFGRLSDEALPRVSPHKEFAVNPASRALYATECRLKTDVEQDERRLS